MVNSANVKGIISEKKVCLFFLENGYEVYEPLSQHCAVDLIVDYNGTLFKLQVKSARVSQKCRSSIKFNTCSITRSGQTKIKYGRTYYHGIIDFFIICFKDELYIVDIDSIPQRTAHFTLSENTKYPCNKNNNSIKNYKKFLDNRIEKLKKQKKV